MISGLHKLSTKEKREFLKSCELISGADIDLLKGLELDDASFQSQLEAFSENVIGNFNLPYSVVPNLVVNGKHYLVPFVTEESSVVAAAASAARFWADKGGFHSKVESVEKVGTVYFSWEGQKNELKTNWKVIEDACLSSTNELSESMRKRGGGILGLSLRQVHKVSSEYKLKVRFDTKNAMGANFINSCLEEMGKALVQVISDIYPRYAAPVLTMCILSNNTPNCLVHSSVSCDVHCLDHVVEGMKGHEFAAKLKRAADIAWHDEDRAVTHNKGIMNGIAAAIVATGNDFRAVEAAAHAYAVKEKAYRALSKVRILNDRFTFSLKIPLAVGTVGGLTSLHPLANLSLKILNSPDAEELMRIIAAAGLASNFAALKSLVSEGIQKGHMKMHLNNLLLNLNASNDEEHAVHEYFKGKSISSAAVKNFVYRFRSGKGPKKIQ